MREEMSGDRGNAHQKYGPPLLGREDTISAIAMPCTGMCMIIEYQSSQYATKLSGCMLHRKDGVRTPRPQ